VGDAIEIGVFIMLNEIGHQTRAVLPAVPSGGFIVSRYWRIPSPAVNAKAAPSEIFYFLLKNSKIIISIRQRPP